MLNLYPTGSSIERDWRNKNAEISKIFDEKSFDLSPKEFEEKCNKVLQDLTSADSNINIAKLLGIKEETIHNIIADNFIPNKQYEIFLDRLHLLNFDRKSGKTTTAITFPDPANQIYAENILSGMPRAFKAEIAQNEFIPFAKSFDRYFAGKIRYLAFVNLGLNPVLSQASAEEFETIKEKAPASFFPTKEDGNFFKDQDYFSIPPSERFRISSLVAHAFGIELRDGSKLLNQYCSSAINATNYNISSCDLLKKSLGKIFWTTSMKDDSGLYYTDGSVEMIKASKENFLPSEFSQYNTIIHEYGHHLLYNLGHPNFDDVDNKFKYFPRENSDYFFGSLSSSKIDKTKTFFAGYYSLDDFCDKSEKIAPIDLVVKKFAQYCSYRFQNNTEIGRNYSQDFKKINLSKIDTDFCMPTAKIDPSKKILFDSFYNFICMAFIISSVDFVLACKRGKNGELKNSRESKINFLSTLLGPVIHGLDSLLITGAKISFSQILKTNFVKNLSESVAQKTGYKDSSMEKLIKDINKSYEKLPRIAKNSLSIIATYQALFFLKDMIGGRPIVSSSNHDFSRFGNLYYDRNIEIFGLFLSSLASSTALGLFNFASEKISDKIYESIHASPQSNRQTPTIRQTPTVNPTISSITPPSIAILTVESQSPLPEIISSNVNFVFLQMTSPLQTPVPLNSTPSTSPSSENSQQLNSKNVKDILFYGSA